ncbi:MAG TPA: autotransporter domain-containing protein [Phenylobacterium sp.]|jgi:outer membrane autotransporter protein
MKLRSLLLSTLAPVGALVGVSARAACPVNGSNEVNVSGAAATCAVTPGSTVSVGRLGLRLARTWSRPADEGPELTTGWLRLNLSHEFMDQPSTTFSSENGPVVFQTDLGSYWAEANVGLTHQMSRASALIANVGYQWHLDKDTHA